MNFCKEKMACKSPGVIAAMVILGILAITGLAILFGFVIMWLWNALMPEIFGLPSISYFQAVGLFILFRILLSTGGSGKKNRSDYFSKRPSKRELKYRSKSKLIDHCYNYFSDWEHYDSFWKDEGEQAYKDYVEKLKKEEQSQTDKDLE